MLWGRIYKKIDTFQPCVESSAGFFANLQKSVISQNWSNWADRYFELTLEAKLVPTLACQLPGNPVAENLDSNFIRIYSAISETLTKDVTAFMAVSVAKINISLGISVGAKIEWFRVSSVLFGGNGWLSGAWSCFLSGCWGTGTLKIVRTYSGLSLFFQPLSKKFKSHYGQTDCGLLKVLCFWMSPM